MALEAIFTAELVDADRAEAWGWVNRAVAIEEIDEIVDGVATRIARLPGAVIKAVWDAIDEGGERC